VGLEEGSALTANLTWTCTCGRWSPTVRSAVNDSFMGMTFKRPVEAELALFVSCLEQAIDEQM
jgi:hypothetical protein